MKQKIETEICTQTHVRCSFQFFYALLSWHFSLLIAQFAHYILCIRVVLILIAANKLRPKRITKEYGPEVAFSRIKLNLHDKLGGVFAIEFVSRIAHGGHFRWRFVLIKTLLTIYISLEFFTASLANYNLLLSPMLWVFQSILPLICDRIHNQEAKSFHHRTESFAINELFNKTERRISYQFHSICILVRVWRMYLSKNTNV